jgi:hypothetical protein
MASKKITIVVVPDGPRKIRQIKIPRFWVFSLVLVFLAGSLSLAWVVRDYISIKRDLPRLSNLQEENTLQKQQITSLAGKVEAINQKMTELKEHGYLQGGRDGTRQRTAAIHWHRRVGFQLDRQQFPF